MVESYEWSFAALSALAAAVTAAVAVWTLLQMREDSRARARPVVVASFRPGPRTSPGILYLAIANTGPSLARDVTIAFDPALPTATTGATGQPAIAGPFITRRYSSPLQMLGPGETLRNVYMDLRNSDEPMPRQLRVDILYRDHRSRAYRDAFNLDVEIYAVQTDASPSGSDHTRRKTEALEALVWEAWAAGE